jgi:hypothetical protein
MLEQLIEANYQTVVDLRLFAEGLEDQAVFEAKNISCLREVYINQHTDLLLLRDQLPTSSVRFGVGAKS